MAALYRHLPDKAALPQALVDADYLAFAEAGRALREIADPGERLRAGARAYVELGLSHPQQHRLLFMPPPRGGDVPLGDVPSVPVGDPALDRYAALRRDVQEALDAGRLRRDQGDVATITQALWAAVHGVVSLHVVRGSQPWLDWRPALDTAALLTGAVLRGLEPPPPPRRRSRRRRRPHAPRPAPGARRAPRRHRARDARALRRLRRGGAARPSRRRGGAPLARAGGVRDLHRDLRALLRLAADARGGAARARAARGARHGRRPRRRGAADRAPGGARHDESLQPAHHAQRLDHAVHRRGDPRALGRLDRRGRGSPAAAARRPRVRLVAPARAPRDDPRRRPPRGPMHDQTIPPVAHRPRPPPRGRAAHARRARRSSSPPAWTPRSTRGPGCAARSRRTPRCSRTTAPAGGGSSAATGPRSTSSAVAVELLEALDAAGLRPPYALVARSIGGLHARVFASRYRDEVAGVVLVDATHEAIIGMVSPDDIAAIAADQRHAEARAAPPPAASRAPDAGRRAIRSGGPDTLREERPVVHRRPDAAEGAGHRPAAPGGVQEARAELGGGGRRGDGPIASRSG